MKQLTTAVADIISQNLGVEPVNILEVQWLEGSNFIKYGDKSISSANIDGIILELSNLESVIKLDSQGQSQGINVVLDDTNGTIKDIINNNDVHGRTVRLLQWFEGLSINEAFQLYEGEITSPIEWNEGDRTISFSVITKLADKEVGFSPEEAQFNFLPNELVGKPWPMAFGTVQNVPATRLQDVPLTQSAEDVGAADPSITAHGSRLGSQETQLRNLYEIKKWQLLQANQNADERLLANDPEGAAFWQGIADALADELGQIATSINELVAEKLALQVERNQQLQEQKDQIEVVNGAAFPQDEVIQVKIDGLLLTGVMNGNVFTISDRVIENFSYDPDSLDPYGFTWIQGGSTFTLQTETDILYIANIIDSEVHSIQVFRQIENGQILITIPTSYYTVEKVTSGPYTFTLIKFAKALSSIDSTLSNDIYVTLTSSIGPNTVDIIKWLISTYTDLSYNLTTFDDVKQKLENYPSHFALLERRNILTTLEEIAMQARCAIWLNNGVFYIKYLSEELVEDLTITESDINANSMILGTTQTEELVTKLVATWTDNYVLEEDHKIILRHNVRKYGTREREINFYIYNINELVLKSATFWLIRLANIWKILTFDTYVSNLVMETFDTVLLDFNTNYVANVPVKSLVADLTYNTNDGLLNVTTWLPVKFGEMVQYDFAWPAYVSVDLEFPTQYEVTKEYDGSAGPGENVNITEITQITIRATRPGYIILDDKGDDVPSDLDDKKPEPRFPFTTFVPGDDPSRPYDYNDYGFIPVEPPPPEEDEFEGAVFPGKVVSEAEGPIEVADGFVYDVDVYEQSLAEAPTRLKVIQLQLIDREVIPSNTWVLVAKNQTATNEQGEKEPGLNEDGFEWTMQVPVWL